MTERQNYITDHVGGEDWAQVEQEFSGKTRQEIADEINGMFPQEDNEKLIDAICEEMGA